MAITRNQFLKGALGAAAIGVLGCGDDETQTPAGSGGAGGTGGQGGQGGVDASACVETISLNHGHVIEVSSADVAAGVEKTYSIQGSSAHDHTVTVTAAHFTTLQGGGMVTIESSSDGTHTHSVDITCGA